MKASKFSRCVKAPIRALVRARDMYVNSMNSYAGKMPSNLPKSFSVNSARTSSDHHQEEDLRTLIRVMSERSQGGEMRQQTRGGGPNSRLPKSMSVGMGKIDEEEEAADDLADQDLKLDSSAAASYPRSRSYAVVNRKTRLQSH
ncbi:hypothetical protein ACLOJK_003434 [Asimina triloba]